MHAIGIRRATVLGAGALIAGFVLAAHRADGEPTRTAEPAKATRTASVETHAAAATTTASPRPEKAMLIGDGALRGALDMTTIKLAGDHYEAALTDHRRAVLTLDPVLQKAAWKVIDHARAPLAAIVVMTTDGRLLAYAGRRNIEPVRAKDFTLPGQVWAPAASVFKIVTASALLDAGIKPTRKVCYHGGFHGIDASNITDTSYDDTCNDLSYAIAESQNAIIAKLAHRHLQPERLARFARIFGFGWAPSMALPAEASHCAVPTGDLEFAQFAAGFWSSELSAVGAAVLVDTIATGGLRVTPRIVAEVTNPAGAATPVVARAPERVLDADIAAQVGKMMEATTETGTARHGFHDRRGRNFLDVSVAGKTGTLARDEPSYLGYSWFVGYAPADDPEIVIAVILGNPAKWWLKGNTAARMVLQARY
ncbi:MAG TPA: penicillin-binding transpeptidase domain-containing protein [Kofleriaceae bacterium]|nr:penicillin-binding transpeptidase domain-containing protein [Kofleriaceae bacterium]